MIKRQYKTPCGILTLGATNEGLCLCVWNNDPHKSLKERKLQHLPKTASAVAEAADLAAAKARSYATASAADKASEAAALTCLTSASRQLNEYFAGTRTTFDISLHIAGTEFQKRVWQQLLKIQYGTTATYKQLAAQIDIIESTAVRNAITTGGFICRAVANACAANPISIIIPCHRVIGSNNRNLTGYAGGLSAKKKLLELEGETATATATVTVLR